jgi:succinyl-diaminopimelate desuccinylase
MPAGRMFGSAQAMDTLTDPLPLAQSLIRCASVTPADAGAQDALAAMLDRLGFTVQRLRFGDIDNIFARLGTEGPHICFAGHTDVVPVGAANWRTDPFGGEVRDGVLYGRGACDMKGAIAAFVAGVAQYLEQGTPKGSISFLITGDEEGVATDGTVKVLEWMRANNQVPDFCLVGEPTCPVKLGDMVKIGRRGSVNMRIEVHGTQGHVAYPNRTDNPIHRLLRALDALTSAPVDAGTDWFEPSSLQVTSIDVGNAATNVVPASARAALNIRFNDGHSGASLTAWVRATLGRYAERFDLESSISGESFVTKPGPMVEILRHSIQRATGIDPGLDTGGGTSDARFIANYCPVAEFGLVGATMHQTDECVPVAELRDLARIYRDIVAAFLT